MKKYKIVVYIPNSKPITFDVSEYKVLENGLIRFIDKFNRVKIFDTRLCEIEEVEEDG